MGLLDGTDDGIALGTLLGMIEGTADGMLVCIVEGAFVEHMMVR